MPKVSHVKVVQGHLDLPECQLLSLLIRCSLHKHPPRLNSGERAKKKKRRKMQAHSWNFLLAVLVGRDGKYLGKSFRRRAVGHHDNFAVIKVNEKGGGKDRLRLTLTQRI